MNLREALVCLVESTESAHGADREGSALWRAREVGLRVVNRLEERDERRRKAGERKRDRTEAARRAVRDSRWDAWERELLGRNDGKSAKVRSWDETKGRKMAQGHQVSEVVG
jgi:hypothetical protein